MIIDLLNYFSPEEIYIKTRDQKFVLGLLIENRNKFSESFINTVRQDSGMSLSRLQKIMKRDEIDSIVTNIKIGRFGKYLKLPLKIELDEDWFYMSEFIRTDGHISKKFIETKITNKDRSLLCRFEEFCKMIGIQYIRKDKELNYYKYRIFNTSLGHIFNKVFEIQHGNKSKIVYMPIWMKRSDKSLLSKALQGAFDGDGGVQFSKLSGTRRIRLSTGSSRYASDIRECLSRFGIYSRVFEDPRKEKNVWYVEIQRKLDLMRFEKEIGFLQKKRSEKLRILLESYTRFTSNEFETSLRKLIASNGKLTITQIAEMLNRSPTTISDRIKKLERAGLVRTERIGIRKFVLLSNKDGSH